MTGDRGGRLSRERQHNMEGSSWTGADPPRCRGLGAAWNVRAAGLKQHGKMRRPGGSMEERTPTADRDLIQALMERGWYRDGQDGPDDAGKSVWRFRSGHSTEDPGQTIRIRSRSQRAAMRALLEQLMQRDADTGDPESTGA
jgi:hypothetical protein